KPVVSWLIRQDKLIISPDLDSRQAIFRTLIPTLVPRGFLGNQEIADKLITNPSEKNEPEIPPGQKVVSKKIFPITFAGSPSARVGERQEPEGTESFRVFVFVAT